MVKCRMCGTSLVLNTDDNALPACKRCNRIRADTFTAPEMISHIGPALAAADQTSGQTSEVVPDLPALCPDDYAPNEKEVRKRAFDLPLTTLIEMPINQCTRTRR